MTRKRILLLTTIAIGSLNFNTLGRDSSIQTETSDSATNATVSTAPNDIYFGALTAIGAGQERSSASGGVYGPFTVSNGQVSPNESPLNPGIYNVGKQQIEVIENTISVSNADELLDAVEDFSDTAIDLEFQLREGNYGLVIFPSSSFDTNTGTVTMTSADPNRMAQMRLTLAGASDGNFGRLIFDHLDFFESYDNFAAEFPDLTATYATSTKFAIVTLANTHHVTFRHCRFRSDFKPSYDTSLGSKWREAKQSQHPNGSFLLIRTTEMLGTQTNLTIEDSEISDIFYGLFIHCFQSYGINNCD